MKKISIIVPVYNAQDTICECIDSIINQTYKNIEIIIVNDSSNDKTLKLLNNYKDKIILISNNNKMGPSYSRNQGLKIATGDYIGFVDADDYVANDMYELLINGINKGNDLVYCARYNIYPQKTMPIYHNDKNVNIKELSNTSNYVWDKLFKKDIIIDNKIDFPEALAYAEDFVFLMKYKFFAKSLAIINKPLYFYNCSNNNSITKSYDKRLLDIITAQQLLVDFYKENNVFDEYKDELLKLSVAFYVRRIKEFKYYNNFNLKLHFVKDFLSFFKYNFKNFKHILNNYNSKHNLFYRSSYPLMVIYILVKNRWR